MVDVSACIGPAFILLLILPGIIVAYAFFLPDEIDISCLVFLTGLILSVSGFLAARFLLKRNLNNGIITMCIGILVSHFYSIILSSKI